MKFNNHIGFVRESKGISLSYLAQRLDVTRSTLYRWEAGDSKVSKRYWSKLANTLNCNVEELFDVEVPEIDLTALANQIEQIFRTNKLLVSNKPLYHQNELLVRSLADALVQTIRSANDIAALHKND